ncbi:MAG: glycosyltransferase family 4 protein [Verrucomicrobia bacterium]|nr:glycosyltransferase family 4 protein [Verrucomicrobiota bacterium]
MPRTLLVGNFLSSARPGSYTVCELLAARLSSAGWPVLTTSEKPARISRLTDMLMTVWRRRGEYVVAQVDVYSGPSFVWAECVCWLLGRLGKPFILTLHGGNLPTFARRWPGRVRGLLISARAVTTPSHYLQEALRAYRDDLLLLPNAIDLAAYQFRLRSNPQPKFIWLRAFHNIYNPSMAVRTLAHLCSTQPSPLRLGRGEGQGEVSPNSAAPSAFSLQPSAFHLTMFGPDKGDGSFERLKAEIGKLQLEDKVRLPGAVPKSGVPAALNSGDIFLNTTNHESFGVSVMEAAACGLCIVSTNVGELPLLWEHGHDALLVPPNDSQAMAAAVRRILTEPGLAERLSLNARAKAEQFDWSVVLPQWEKLLTEVAGNLSRAVGSRTIEGLTADR